MTQPNPIGLAVVLPITIFLAGVCTGAWMAIRLHMRVHKQQMNPAPAIEPTRASGIERYWMENGA